jgi:hypothetical protein
MLVLGQCAMTDKNRSVQHNFFLAGYSNGPAGVFRLPRAMNTPELAGVLSR